METLVLTVAEPSGAVLPRRLALDLAPGAGRLALPAEPDLDPTCRDSLAHAWGAALALAGRADVDGRLRVAGRTPIRGGSAGLSFGLLALSALLGESLPPHFATGAVVDGRGMLAGGAFTLPKARAAAGYAPQLGMEGARFLTPPVPGLPEVPGMPVLPATDLGSALAVLSPALHARVLPRHRALLDARALRGADAEAPFLLPEGGWLWVGERGLLLWRVPDPAPPGLPADLPGLLGLARAASALAR